MTPCNGSVAGPSQLCRRSHCTAFLSAPPFSLHIFLTVPPPSSALSSAKIRICVTFVDKDGEEQRIKVPIRMSMLEAAHENDIELEGGNEYGQCGEEPERKDDTGRPLKRDSVYQCCLICGTPYVLRIGCADPKQGAFATQNPNCCDPLF